VRAAEATARTAATGLFDPAVGCTMAAQVEAFEEDVDALLAAAPAAGADLATLRAAEARSARLVAAGVALGAILHGDRREFPLVAAGSALDALAGRVDAAAARVDAARTSAADAIAEQAARRAAEKAASHAAAASGSAGSAGAGSAEPWNSPGPDLDCADVGRKVRITGPDYHRLDADGDGWGCDSYG
jgi:hypothetical protein